MFKALFRRMRWDSTHPTPTRGDLRRIPDDALIDLAGQRLNHRVYGQAGRKLVRQICDELDERHPEARDLFVVPSDRPRPPPDAA